jgi:hypothetical protein
VTLEDKDRIYDNPNFNANSQNIKVICCVHGTADKPSAFHELIKNISADMPSNIKSVYCFSYRGRKRNIAYFSKKLISKIKKFEYHNVIFIGHSRGGLICTYLAENLAPKQNIRICGVVTIGTPFKGSKLAPPLAKFAESINEMQIGSPFLLMLNESITLNKYNHKYLLVAGDKDFIVDKSSSQPSIPLAKYSLLADQGHLSILLSGELARLIIDFLKSLES